MLHFGQLLGTIGLLVIVTSGRIAPVKQIISKMGHPRTLFQLFVVFSNKHYKFYNKLIWKMSSAGIRTHNLLIICLLL